MSKERREEPTVQERRSAKAVSEVVLRFFRGEGVDEVSREIQVPVHELETWRKGLFTSRGAASSLQSGACDSYFDREGAKVRSSL